MYRLRNLNIEDTNSMLEWMHDEDINKQFVFDAKSATRESVKQFIENSWVDEENKHYAIVDKNDEYCGTISLKNINKNNKNAEYAIALRSKYMGSGVAAYATKEIVKIAFEELSLIRVYLNVLAENSRAIGFYEKMGFEFEGEFRQHLFKEGKYRNLKWYAIVKGDTYE